MHLGIDLGGTKIEAAVLDATSQIIFRKRVASPRGNYDDTCNAVLSLIREAESAVGADCTLGMGIPGSISPHSGLVQNANSTWLIGKAFAEDLSRKLKRNIFLANDADCFALSEACDGAAMGAKCVFGVILGTGVGGGICVENKPLVGPNAITGEWGHNPMHYSLIDTSDRHQNLHACYCGREHCIETYLSGPALVAQFNAGTQSTIARLEDLMRHQDAQLREQHLQLFCERLAASLAGVVNILDPDCIVLGGGVSNLDDLDRKLQEAMKPYVFSEAFVTPIRKAKYGDSSGVRGAAWLGKLHSA